SLFYDDLLHVYYSPTRRSSDLLHVQPRGVGPRQVLCIHHPRNLRERWTSRFDWRLPTTSDGARYPFCVPRQWWKGSTTAFRTVSDRKSTRLNSSHVKISYAVFC